MNNTLLVSLVFSILSPVGLALAHGSEADSVARPAAASEASAADDEVLLTLRVPLMSPYFSETPVAVVNEEPITFRDLTKRISSIHTGMADEETSVKKDYADLLDRVVRSQLIVQEALNIGLDELPEVETQIDTISEEMLISKVMARALEEVEADPKDVKELYEKMSRELLLTTVKFANEQDALEFEEGFGSGEAFSELVTRFVEREGVEASAGEYLKLKELLPQVAQTAFDMEHGTISQIFADAGGFFLFYLEGERFVEDPKVEEEARQIVITPVRQEAARKYANRLQKKHATVDEGLLRSVDFENERSGFLSLGKTQRRDLNGLVEDDRVVATVDGEPPFLITIGDIATAVNEVFFHGIETAIAKRDMNDEKQVVLKNMLFKKVVVAEAREQGLDQTLEYENAMKETTDSILFNTFVKKIVVPDVELDEEEVRQYYAEHIDDFSSPKMLRTKGLAFNSRDDARAALRKIQKGADFKWVSANSPGLVASGTQGVFDFSATSLTVSALPEEIRKKAEDARRGEALLYSDPKGLHYTIVVEKVFPPTPKAYEAVRTAIARTVFEQKVQSLVDEWSEKLKESYETRIFVVPPEG